LIEGGDVVRALLVSLSLGISAPSFAAEADVIVVAKAKKKTKTKTKTRRNKKRKKKRRRRRGPVTVPIDIGVGPAVHLLTGPLQDDQTLHYGLKISLEAVIGRKLIRQNLHRVPRKYRAMAKRQREVRLRPGLVALVPDTLYISPRRHRTAMYGANWRLLGIGTGLGERVRLHAGARLGVSYAYIDSDDAALGTTHFLRPGLSGEVALELPLAKSFLVSLGWSSYLYPPQNVGGPIFEWGEADRSLWHVGQAFVKLHFRVPYTTTL